MDSTIKNQLEHNGYRNLYYARHPHLGLKELECFGITKRAMFSRAVAGIRGRTLIVNLPGSPKAVRECLEFVLPDFGHGLDILKGSTGECAR